jgi:repressor LexA
MPRPKKLTRERVLDAINDWLVQHGIPPTVEELRKVLGVGSKQTVLRYLEWLTETGDIERSPGRARGLRSLGTGSKGLDTRVVPVVGTVPAGPLMLAEENIEGWVQIPKRMAPTSSRYFLLRVHGNSMNKARVRSDRIEDGDLVLIRQQATAEDGQIIVALIDDEATIKRLVRQPGYFMLKPESTDPKHRPIIVDREFRVQGVAVQVLKRGSTVFQ